MSGAHSEHERLLPPLLKYDTTWDTSSALNFLASWYPNVTLSLEYNSRKLDRYLLYSPLQSAHRVQTTHPLITQALLTLGLGQLDQCSVIFIIIIINYIQNRHWIKAWITRPTLSTNLRLYKNISRPCLKPIFTHSTIFPWKARDLPSVGTLMFTLTSNSNYSLTTFFFVSINKAT